MGDDKARAKAILETVNGALEKAFRGAPELLFVAGAGNEDEDVDFVRSFPAGINLPNLITVGAMDVALQPAGFPSYGKSIVRLTSGRDAFAATRPAFVTALKRENFTSALFR